MASRNRRAGGRVTPKAGGRVWPDSEDGLPPIEAILPALGGFDDIGDRPPLDIEQTVSTFLSQLGAGRAPATGEDEPDYEELLHGLVEVGLAHLDQQPPRAVLDFLWVIDAFGLPWLDWPLHDRLESAAVPSLPAWAHDVGRASVVSAHRITHETGDGDDIALIARHGSADQDHVVAVYVNHTLGGLATDVLVHPDAAKYLELSAEAGLAVNEIELEVAAAIIDEGVDKTLDAGVPGAVADSFSEAYELVEHYLDKIRVEGTAVPEPAPAATASRIMELVEAFLASLTGLRHTADAEPLLAAVEFVNDELGGDPLRWTPSVTEVIVRAWLPSAGFDDDVVDRFPDVLRAFVPWAHEEKGWEDRYLDEVRAVLDAGPDAGPGAGAPTGGAELLDQAIAAGVDLNDEQALDAFLDNYLDG